MGSMKRRIRRLEEYWGVGEVTDEEVEEARRQRIREKLSEMQRRIAAVVRQEGGDPDLGQADEDVRDLYCGMFGCEAGSEEYEKRKALARKYGAASLAPRSEQAKLRRMGGAI